jgi:NAD(P)-dependent dehydrogenase (short-subunit alcohol dehydrogenase family)
MMMKTENPKICLITGATSGIGKATAVSLAQKAYKLLLVARSREKGESLQQEILGMSPSAPPELYIADLSSQSSIHTLVKTIQRNHARIDVLINNAGGIFGSHVTTVDGIELTFALNHLGYFLLSNLLLDQLKAGGNSRIVNVSSQAHRLGTRNLDDQSSGEEHSAMKSYAQSKLANLLFTYELSRRLADTPITVNALHPGSVHTNFGRELPGVGGAFFRYFDFLLRSPEKGAETVIWLASADEAAGITGKYFLDKKEIRSSQISYDVELAKRLWDVSSKMTNLA